MAPDGVLQSIPLERLAVQHERFLLPLDGHDEIAGHFFDVVMHAVLGGGHRGVDASWYGLSQLEQAGRATIIASHRYLRIDGGTTRIEHRAHACERLIFVVRDVELHQQEHGRAHRSLDTRTRGRLVRSEGQRATVHELDRGDVQHAVAAPARHGLLPECRRDRHGLTIRSACHKHRASPWERDDAERRCGHDPECALRSDEEIDEIHAGMGEIASRQFRHLGHRVGRNRRPDDVARGRLELEPPVW